jgi:ESCRT-I complex subunit TSG101
VATPYPPPTSTAGAAYPPAYPAPVSTASESNTSTITQEHVLMSLRSAVEDMVRRRLREEYNMKNVEIQSLTKIKDELNGGQNQLQCAIGQIEKDTITVETAVRELLREEESMKEALQRAKAVGNEAEMSPDEAVMAPTPLYKQLVQAHAEEAAVHEAIYYLGEALKQEVIDCDVFLKQVRKLARKQFFLKATMNKCRHVAGLPV